MTYLGKCGLLIIMVSPFGMANTLLDELSLCAKNIDNLQRLTCYDTLTDKAKNSQPKDHKQQASLQVEIIKRVDNTTQPLQKSLPEPVLAGSKHPEATLIAEPQQTVELADKTNQQLAIFGQENKQRTENLIEQIQATIIEIKKAPRGELIITLDNGQVWRQTDNTRLKLRKDQVVIIKRGAFGSFFIRKENTNKRIRAKRVK
jgi:hypothetical protein